MDYTKGEWKVTHSLRRVWGVNEDTAAVIPICVTTGDNKGEANANLIVAAVNACVKLNPDNPMDAAESISDMLEAVKVALWDGEHDEYQAQKQGHPRLIERLEIYRKALSKSKR